MSKDKNEKNSGDGQKPAEPDKDVAPPKIVLVQDGASPEKVKGQKNS